MPAQNEVSGVVRKWTFASQMATQRYEDCVSDSEIAGMLVTTTPINVCALIT